MPSFSILEENWFEVFKNELLKLTALKFASLLLLASWNTNWRRDKDLEKNLSSISRPIQRATWNSSRKSFSSKQLLKLSYHRLLVFNCILWGLSFWKYDESQFNFFEKEIWDLSKCTKLTFDQLNCYWKLSFHEQESFSLLLRNFKKTEKLNKKAMKRRSWWIQNSSKYFHLITFSFNYIISIKPLTSFDIQFWRVIVGPMLLQLQ